MKFILFILIVVFSTGHAVATNYYLSATGNDNQDGKSIATRWRSLKKLSQVMNLLQAGDSVLLERGSVFEGNIFVSGSGIYLGAYGFGPKPVLTGSVAIDHWASIGKNIWRAECPECINEPGKLLLDGKSQPLGRYPNQGYLPVSGSNQPEMSMTDSSLHFTDGYWNGAQVVIKSNRWTLDCLPIQDYRHQTFRYEVQSTYPLQPGFGYFIQRHESTLDEPGEWFFNPITRQVLIFMDPGVNPNDHSIEVNVVDAGLQVSGASEVTVRDLVFKDYNKAGTILQNSAQIELTRIEISNSGENGLKVVSCKNVEVAYCLITDSNNNGVLWHNNLRGKFSYNSIRRTGMHPGRGLSGNGNYIGLIVTADTESTENTMFQFNTIDSTGYIGIDFRTGHTQIKDNHITNFCMTKDDGAGIYTWGNRHGNNLIENNTITNGIGNGDGTQGSNQRFASGVYIDDLSNHIIVSNNTISHCATAGIFLHNAKFIVIRRNTLFANGNNVNNKERGQLYIKLDTFGSLAGPALHLDVSQNNWSTQNEASYCVFIGADRKSYLNELGIFRQNKFSAFNANRAIATSYTQSGLCSAPQEYTLEDWQRNTNNEIASTFTLLQTKGNFNLIGKNMISNGNMTTDLSGWMAWPAGSTLSLEPTKIADGHSLMVNVPLSETEVLLYHAGFGLNKHKLYRLTFSVMSARPGKIEFESLMATSPWEALTDHACFLTDSTYRTYTYFFRPERSFDQARVNFKSNATFRIDAVSLYEVVDHDR